MTTDKDRADKEHAPREPTAQERADKERAAKEPLAGGAKGAATTESTALPPEAYMTEQEKEALAKGGSKAPYPTGDPPPVHETVTRSQGIKGATDPKETPVESSGPAGTTKKETK